MSSNKHDLRNKWRQLAYKPNDKPKALQSVSRSSMRSRTYSQSELEFANFAGTKFKIGEPDSFHITAAPTQDLCRQERPPLSGSSYALIWITGTAPAKCPSTQRHVSPGTAASKAAVPTRGSEPLGTIILVAGATPRSVSPGTAAIRGRSCAKISVSPGTAATRGRSRATSASPGTAACNAVSVFRYLSMGAAA